MANIVNCLTATGHCFTLLMANIVHCLTATGNSFTVLMANIVNCLTATGHCFTVLMANIVNCITATYNYFTGLKDKWFTHPQFRKNCNVFFCALATIVAAGLFSRTRIVKALDKAALNASSNSTVPANELFIPPSLQVQILASLTVGIIPLVCAGFAYCNNWLPEGRFFKISSRILAFAITTAIFFFASRLQAKSELYKKLKPAASIRAFDENLQQIFGIHFDSVKDIADLVFIDPWTISVVFVYSAGAVCFARLFETPEPWYMIHEVFMDLTFYPRGRLLRRIWILNWYWAATERTWHNHHPLPALSIVCRFRLQGRRPPPQHPPPPLLPRLVIDRIS